MEPKIFLCWGGEIYGPSSPEEIINGLRTSWFEVDAFYWHEGMPEWKPIAEFSASSARQTPIKNWTDQRIAVAPQAPELPSSEEKNASSRARGSRAGSSKKRTHRPGHPGAAVIIGFAFLGVLLTVGIIIILMLV